MGEVSLVQAQVPGGGDLGLATLAGLPTCAFLDTLAGGGVTVGVLTGVGFGFAGELKFPLLSVLCPPEHLTAVSPSLILLLQFLVSSQTSLIC